MRVTNDVLAIAFENAVQAIEEICNEMEGCGGCTICYTCPWEQASDIRQYLIENAKKQAKGGS